MGARVERGRALKYGACAQDLTCHFGGVIQSAESAESAESPEAAESAETVPSAAGRTPPSTRAGGQDDVSYTNSLKQMFLEIPTTYTEKDVHF